MAGNKSTFARPFRRFPLRLSQHVSGKPNKTLREWGPGAGGGGVIVGGSPAVDLDSIQGGGREDYFCSR